MTGHSRLATFVLGCALTLSLAGPADAALAPSARAASSTTVQAGHAPVATARVVAKKKVVKHKKRKTKKARKHRAPKRGAVKKPASAPVVTAPVTVVTPKPTPAPSPKPTPSPSPTPAPTSGASASPAPVSSALAATISSSRTTAADILQRLVARDGASDPRFYSNGVWVDGSSNCFRCTLGPSVLAATLAAATGDQQALQRATAPFDLAIRTHQRADGAIVPPAPGETGPDIQTVFFGAELSSAYTLLAGRLTTAQRAQWRESILQTARFLIRNGNLRWYTNGNIMIATSLLVDVARRISGSTEFDRAAQDAESFMLAPPSPRWEGFGLKYSTYPTKADGSDGAGFLAESGGSTPGYDPAYTLLQSNLAAQWFMITGNPTARRLTNLFVNQLLQRVRTSDWTIDVSGGTRRAAAGVRYPFVTSALPVAAWWAGRTDLQAIAGSQLAATLASYRGATTYTHDGMSYGYGVELSTALMSLTMAPQTNGLLGRAAAR